MLRKASAITGSAIAAKNGEIGTVSDLLFDNGSWSVRWLVVDTGNFLSRHRVLLPVSSVTAVVSSKRQFTVNLTVQQAKNSPDVDTDLPVSRQMECNIYGFYGWDPYWIGLYEGASGVACGPGLGSPLPQSMHAKTAGLEPLNEGDPHLRSIAEVTGYHIEASDGPIGHVEDFLVRDGEWRIDYLVIDTNNWWAGTGVLISPKSVKEIDWIGRLVKVDADRKAVKESPAYDPSAAIDPLYEKQFLCHDG